MKRISIFMALIFLVLTFEINAQYDDTKNERGNIGIGPQIGYQRSGDSDAGSFMFGGFFRAKLSPAFGLEASINYREEQIRNGQVTARSWPVLLSAVVYPFPMFYGIAGGGWYHTTFDYDPGFQHADLADKTKNPFGWHLGAGVEVPLSDNVQLLGDVKYVFLKYKFEEFGEIPLDDINSNFYIINVGIAFGLR